MKRLVIVSTFGILFSIIFAVNLVVAQPYTCADDLRIFSISTAPNGHAQLWSQTAYPFDLCYNNYFVGAPSSNSHSCSPGNVVVKISSDTNAHLENPVGSTYSTEVCYGNLDCRLVDTNLGQGCVNGEESAIISLSAISNAHAGASDEYRYLLCCQDTGGNEPICNNDGNCDSGEDEFNCPNDNCEPSGGVCGDGTVEAPEECDVGSDTCIGVEECNLVTCQCELPGGPVCGDGNLDPGEECELGVSCTVDGEECTNSCLCEPGGIVCSTDADCDDDSLCTQDSCNSATNECEYNPASPLPPQCDPFECNVDSDCNDSDQCTLDTCENLICVYHAELPPPAGCENLGCSQDSDCTQDGNDCTITLCIGDESGPGICLPQDNPDSTDSSCTGCVLDSECDDTIMCTTDSCVGEQQGEGVCFFDDSSCGNTCSSDADCDDNSQCTLDTCDALGFCVYTDDPSPPAGCIVCSDDTVCDDGDICTVGMCIGEEDDGVGVCVFNAADPLPSECGPECFSDADCGQDSDLCTTHVCIGEETGNGVCLPQAADPLPLGEGCVECLTDGECFDAFVCTEDFCSGEEQGAGICINDPIPGCTDGNLCPNGDVDCDDSNDCTQDSCDDVLGICRHITDPSCQPDQPCNTESDCAGPNTCEVVSCVDDLCVYEFDDDCGDPTVNCLFFYDETGELQTVESCLDYQDLPSDIASECCITNEAGVPGVCYWDEGDSNGDGFECEFGGDGDGIPAGFLCRSETTQAPDCQSGDSTTTVIYLLEMINEDGEVQDAPNACTDQCNDEGVPGQCIRTIDCPNVVQLPFFGYAQFIIALVLIGLIYLVHVTRRE